MTTEQKAKAYDEAIERASKLRVQNPFDTVSQMMEHVFPELCESKDERIRKTLINFFQDWHKNRSHCWGISVPEILAWLEKQGTSYTKKDVDDAYVEGMVFAKNELEKQSEQKPAEWSEEDECTLNGILDDYKSMCKTYRNWLESLKNRIQPQPKQEWSEEDEAGLGDAMWAIEQARTIAKDENDMGNLWCAERWLKSLKERCTWKPSYKQTDALKIAADGCADQTVSQILSTLYKDLKKLTK